MERPRGQATAVGRKRSLRIGKDHRARRQRHREPNDPVALGRRQFKQDRRMLSYGPSDQAIVWLGYRSALSLPWTANDLTDRELSRHKVPAGVCRLQSVDQIRWLGYEHH